MHTIREVIDQGMCVGCGACSAVTGGAVSVTLQTRGAFEANLGSATAQQISKASRACPFSDESKNEDELANELYRDLAGKDDVVGHYSKIGAGRVADEMALNGSSSGGLTSWVAARLIEERHVDGVLHVGKSAQDDLGLFTYRVSHSTAEILADRKSDYYATSFADALDSIRGNGKTYAVIGVPCFIRAARLTCAEDSEIASQLLIFLGLVCGHLKSAAFAESMAWQVGIAPQDLEGVDFRIKRDSGTSSDYDFGARSRASAEIRSAPTNSLLGGNWGHGMFQLNACNYCDDIFAETADAAFGDAWLPEYSSDPRGTNIVVSRNAIVDDILDRGIADGAISWDDKSAASAGQSQAGNYRHRRIGLAVRLLDDLKAGRSTPRKRTAPSYAGVTNQRLKLIRLRRHMSVVSHEAFARAKEQNDLAIFTETMNPLVEQYSKLNSRSFFRKVLGRLVLLGRRR